MRFRLTDSQAEARRALQCFIAHIGDPGRVHENEEYSPSGDGVSDGQGGFLKVAIFRDRYDAALIKVLLHKHEWDPKQQYGFRWWRAVRLQYWPNERNYPGSWMEFELEPVEFSSGKIKLDDREWYEMRFKYGLKKVEATRPIEIAA